ncbi:MAG: hypothetical protein ACLP8Y_08755 [Thermoplasmata archaeon]
MAKQTQGRFRRFLSTTPGKITLIVIAILTVFASSAYVLVVVAIPAILLFGLALPIWAGLKRPRFLAVVGLIVMLAVPPIATVVFTQDIMTPVGAASSSSDLSVSNGSAVMQNATVKPFLGTTSTNFTWTVWIYPQNVAQNNSTPVWLDLYISTCPGATGNGSLSCTQPYPLTIFNRTLNPNATSPYVETFHYQIGSDGVWEWQMGLWTLNRTTHRPFFQLLVGDPTYNGIEGPVIGGFGTIYGELILSVYVEDLIYLGAPFYFVLLIYMLFKNRERRKKDAQQRAPGPIPDVGVANAAPPPSKGSPLPSSKSSSGSPAGPPDSATASQELNCPKCNAVVYVGETSCWKCGAALPATQVRSVKSP